MKIPEEFLKDKFPIVHLVKNLVDYEEVIQIMTGYTADLQAEIAALKAEREWISVKDRLPEKSTPFTGKGGWGENKVLCYSPSTIGISTGYYWGENNDPMNGWSFMGVTHWKPLPSPPNEEK